MVTSARRPKKNTFCTVKNRVKYELFIKGIVSRCLKILRKSKKIRPAQSGAGRYRATDSRLCFADGVDH